MGLADVPPRVAVRWKRTDPAVPETPVAENEPEYASVDLVPSVVVPWRISTYVSGRGCDAGIVQFAVMETFPLVGVPSTTVNHGVNVAPTVRAADIGTEQVRPVVAEHAPVHAPRLWPTGAVTVSATVAPSG